MIDVGFWEMAFIGVIALIIIGPERMPGVVRTAGTWFSKARRMVNDVKRDFRKEMDQADMQSVKDLQKEIKSTAEDFKRVADDADVREATSNVNRAVGEMKKDLDGIETLNSPSNSSRAGKVTAKKSVKKKPAKKKSTASKKKAAGVAAKKATGKKKSTAVKRSAGTGKKKKKTTSRGSASKKVSTRRSSVKAGPVKKVRPAKLTKKASAKNAPGSGGRKPGVRENPAAGA